MSYINLIKNDKNKEMNKIYYKNKLLYADYSGNNKNNEKENYQVDDKDLANAKIKWIAEEKKMIVDVYFYQNKSNFYGNAVPKKVKTKDKDGEEKDIVIFVGTIKNNDDEEVQNIKIFPNESKNGNKYFSLKIETIETFDNEQYDIDEIMDSI